MQQIAAEMGYSETTFVLPPKDPENTASIRIFTPKAELPFAGHPNVGTGFVLAAHPVAAPVAGKMEMVSHGSTRWCVMHFEEIAGLVEVVVEVSADGSPKKSRITAPQAFRQRAGHSNEDMARALGLDPKQVVSVGGRSSIASVGIEFPLVQVSGLEALEACCPQIDAFHRLGLHPETPGDAAGTDDPFLVYVYCRAYRNRRLRSIRARMFDPLHGIFEDPATGSAAGALACLLAEQENLQGRGRYEILQGEEMLRPSRIIVDVIRDNGQILKTQITGHCVEVIKGTFTLS